jgi:hypothetical protein
MPNITPQAASNMTMPAGVLARLAEDAKLAAASERPAVGNFSTQSGVLSYSGTPVPGNKIELVIMTAAFRNVWYAGKFDRNNIVAPNCFALSLADANMQPHANVQEPAAASCAGCPNNEWGSDPNGGRGKACKQSRRLIMLPADAIDKGADAVMNAEFAKMDIPVTSVKNYSSYVNSLAASANVPTYAAITEVSIVPDMKTQFKINFRPMRVLPNEDVLNAVLKRMDGAKALALEPYAETALLADAAAPVEEPPARSPGKKKF